MDESAGNFVSANLESLFPLWLKRSIQHSRGAAAPLYFNIWKLN